ncbi:invasion associated locus B family protein [Prosthecomicrobium sp. N25]|uniref:invasion associated locus B family protein n=1 Tax=Prosthecomicrobium sp. N25 TaxID=3129254 RepID=UPI0030786073
MQRLSSHGALAALVFAAAASGAEAQQPQRPPAPAARPAQAAPAPAVPPVAPPTAAAPVGPEDVARVSTAVYGDWTLRCESKGNAKVCEVTQALQVEGQQGPIARVAFGREAGKSAFTVAVLLPTNVTIPPGVKLAPAADETGLQIPFQQCGPGGCIASTAASDDLVRRFRAQTATAQLGFTTAAGQPIAVNFPMRGFAQAMDALAKE